MDEIENHKRLKVFLMGGTKDSINIIKFLKEEYDYIKSPYIFTTTTTDYGGKIAKEAGTDVVITKPLNKFEITAILEDEKFDFFIDATHPYASHVTKTAIECAKIVHIPYIRFERTKLKLNNLNNFYRVKTFEEAGKLIATNWKSKNILHLAGVNTMKNVLKYLDKKNFFIRVLPVKSSIEKCNENGIIGDHIIAMQGIFSKEFNKSLMKELKTEIIITKESGDVGGVPSKLTAANELGITIILIDRPEIDALKNEVIVNDLNQLKKKLDNIKNLKKVKN